MDIESLNRLRRNSVLPIRRENIAECSEHELPMNLFCFTDVHFLRNSCALFVNLVGHFVNDLRNATKMLKLKMERKRKIKISEYKHHCQDRTVSVNFSFYRFLLRCHIELRNLFNIFLLAVRTTFLAFRCGPDMASIRET